jgi:hypothetical protein
VDPTVPHWIFPHFFSVFSLNTQWFQHSSDFWGLHNSVTEEWMWRCIVWWVLVSVFRRMHCLNPQGPRGLRRKVLLGLLDPWKCRQYLSKRHKPSNHWCITSQKVGIPKYTVMYVLNSVSKINVLYLPECKMTLIWPLKNKAGEQPQAARILRSWVWIPPGAWIFVGCECRVLTGRGLCDELITRPGESYRLCCVVVCDLETSRIGAPYIYIWH